MENKIVSKEINLIHKAMLGGPILALIFFYYNVQNRDPSSFSPNQTMQTVALVVGIASTLFGQIRTRLMAKDFIQKSKLNKSYDLKSYKSFYQVIKLVQFATVEGSALFNLVIYFTMAGEANLFMGIALLIFLAYIRPSDKDFFSILKVSVTDFQNKKEVDFN